MKNRDYSYLSFIMGYREIGFFKTPNIGIKTRAQKIFGTSREQVNKFVI